MERSITKTSSNKLKWVYFIGCVLIILLHSTRYKYFAVSSICAYLLDYFALFLPELGVPLFFVISGFLMFKDIDYTLGDWYTVYKRKLQNRIRTLFTPYIIFNIFWMFFTIFEQEIPFINSHINSALRFEYTISNVVDGIFLFKYNGVAWYLLFLMIYTILFPIVFFSLRKRKIGGGYSLYVLFCPV